MHLSLQTNKKRGGYTAIMTPANPPKLYFPGLNGLRFIAAFSVFFAHANHFFKFLGGDAIEAYFTKVLGHAGVGLFFVISGYLITYLLLIEKENYQRINMGNFYVRRILRIWPLYYFVLIITMIVLPLFFHDEIFSLRGISDVRSFLLFILFMPFVSMCIYPTNFMANILWSVGVEEMYYIFWPVIIQSAKKISLGLFAILLIGFTGIRAVITYLPYKVHTAHAALKTMSDIMSLISFDHMLIGGMMAFIALRMPRVLAFVRYRAIFAGSLILLLCYLFIGYDSFYFGINPIVQYILDPLIFAALCAIIVANVTHDTALSSVLETKFFFFMGQISYGFYVYHSIVLYLLIQVMLHMFGMSKTGLPLEISLYIAGFALTTFVSYISYHYFEARFLRFKKKFTIIVSGNEARPGGDPDSK